MTEYTIVQNERFKPSLRIVEEYDIDESNNVGTEEICENILKSVYHLDELESEHAYLIALNNRDEIMASYHISIGDYSSCNLYSRTTAIFLLLSGAKKFLTAHNHPSGSLNSSPADDVAYGSMCALSNLLEIEYMDNIIVTMHGWFSMKTNNKNNWFIDK